jgi:hypothetical protein
MAVRWLLVFASSSGVLGVRCRASSMTEGEGTCVHFDQVYLRKRISEVVRASTERLGKRGRSVDGG